MKKNVDQVVKEILQELSRQQTVEILGKPLTIDEDIKVIPLLKTSLVFGEVKSHLPFDKIKRPKNELLFEMSDDIYPSGGGNLGNIKQEPCAILLINKGKVKFIRMEEKNAFLNIMEMAKDMFISSKSKK